MSRPSRPKMLTPRPGVTEIDDFGDNCDDIDVEDKVQLFEGNIHSREYYLQRLEEFNDAAFDGEDLQRRQYPFFSME